jgi:RING finger protein 121
VDMNAFKKNPWDTAQILYLNLLDALRYLLVWNPVVFVIVHFIFVIFGFK